MTQSTLMQEIEEEVQRKKLEALWRRYGGLVLGAAIIIVLGTAAFTGWKNYRGRVESASTAALMQVLSNKDLEKAQKIEALDAFAVQNKGENQAVLAKFFEAGLLIKNGDTEKALALYDAMAADTHLDKVFRDLADLMAVQSQLDKGDPAKLRARLQNLMTADSAWAASAKEYSAHLALKAGDQLKAGQLFTELAQDKSAPEALTRRAADMARLIGAGQQ